MTKRIADAAMWGLDWIITASALLAGFCIKVRTKIKKATR